ncbi:MAG: M50 family metallopeptidase [Roseibium sp.]|uniref:M50 family metallopeptidase n=1 Tax=Roseibium sp. TaxID=1936156 RepID=UPI001B227ED7|nr:M50 family metallopeptidase [Roseibium sp.]MBO6509279.1 M50 family metallopeptidase [Roseibium sp.]MBO6892898.1 M50 family metallopeptidase [Roseibium sp.]MBO6927999.1 M50 family metallopeptidase [Roseibium sp.]
MHILKNHWQLMAITLLIFVAWNTPVVLPLKFLVVYMHELAHGLAAVLTGGSIVEISLSPQQGGFAITRGGSRFLILTAGYLGSMLIGAALLLIALRTSADRLVMGLFGIIMLLVTVFYVRELFPLVFCSVTGLAMLAAARFLSREINDMALRVIGLTSLIYVPYDIFDDTIARSGLRSDAYMLAEEFGGPTIFWGGLWLVISLGVLYLCLRYGIGESSNLKFRKAARD